MRRQNKITQADRIRHRKNSTLRLVILWAGFLLSAAAVFLWARAENQRIISEYQQSTECDRPGQKDCRVTLEATVVQTSIFDAGYHIKRGSGAADHDIGVQIVLRMPDASTEIIRVSENDSTWYKGDEIQQIFWFSSGEPFGIQTGDIVSVTSWKNKIVTVETKNALVFHTADHPENHAKVHYPMLWSIFSILLVVLIIWTGYEVLNK